MNENEQYYHLLIQRYVQQIATEEEVAVLFELLEKDEIDNVLQNYLKEDSEEFLQAPVHVLTDRNRIRRYVGIAAAVLLLIGTSYFLYRSTKHTSKDIAKNERDSIMPGVEKAVLIADDGTETILNRERKEIVGRVENVVLTNDSGKLIIGNSTAEIPPGTVKTYTVKTPRGSKYSLVLPDGSKVWLNAASSITFPTVFQDARTVSLQGEAYFEIVHDSKRKFKVETASQVIEDIGTSFNVSCYNDDIHSTTTLIEGSVRLSSPATGAAVTLQPAQQASLEGTQWQIRKDVDVEEAIAWKNDKFMFSGASIESVMKQISRWYDVDIVYEGERTSEEFVGIISRESSISQILQMLETTHAVHFNIQGKKIIVKSSGQK